MALVDLAEPTASAAADEIDISAVRVGEAFQRKARPDFERLFREMGTAP
jgi:hypothetical protein